MLALSPRSDPDLCPPGLPDLQSALPAVRPARAARSPGLLLVDQHHARRAELECFVHQVYARRYQADVQQFAPLLVGLQDEAGEIVAAAGYRAAGPAPLPPLFLESYLPAPVEALLGLHAAQPPLREHIVEVGHLAASRAGEGRRLILLLGPHLAAQGFQWVVSTLTEELRHLFLRLGIAPLALGGADPALLGPSAAQWGSYYQHHPLVLAGRIDAALPTLMRRGRSA